MNDDVIVAIFVVLDELMRLAGQLDHVLAGVSDSEVLAIDVVDAACSQNYLARVLQGMRYPSGHLSTSRSNYRLPALTD